MVDDAEAMRRCQQGDIAGLAALVARYQVTAVRVAFLLVRDRALAEDIVQDSFLLAYRASGRFRLGAPFAPWFYQIVLNAARQQQRAIRVCRSTSRWSGRVARWCCRCSFSRR
jgi:RNA polymerase sigma-70 factor (ECF subfamily)